MLEEYRPRLYHQTIESPSQIALGGLPDLMMPAVRSLLLTALLGNCSVYAHHQDGARIVRRDLLVSSDADGSPSRDPFV